MKSAEDWPTEIRLRRKGRILSVTFESGEAFDLDAEYLRISSPSAEVQGHSPAERRTVPGKINVAIVNVLAVGNYAVRLIFDDGHDTGIFTWTYLRELGVNRVRNWAAYLAELSAKKLKREP
jgi:DUF971 family protein